MIGYIYISMHAHTKNKKHLRIFISSLSLFFLIRVKFRVLIVCSALCSTRMPFNNIEILYVSYSLVAIASIRTVWPIATGLLSIRPRGNFPMTKSVKNNISEGFSTEIDWNWTIKTDI